MQLIETEKSVACKGQGGGGGGRISKGGGGGGGGNHLLRSNCIGNKQNLLKKGGGGGGGGEGRDPLDPPPPPPICPYTFLYQIKVEYNDQTLQRGQQKLHIIVYIILLHGTISLFNAHVQGCPQKIL